MIRYQTEKGMVILEPQVFALIAMDIALKREEIYAVTNARGKVIRQRENGRENINYIEVTPSEQSDGVDLKIYVIMNFGKSISTAAQEFGRAVREQIRSITGVPVGDLTMIVTGVRSKKIARRDLEIKC